MKIRDYIFLATKNLSRRKKTIIVNSILIFIAVFVFITALSFSNSIKRNMDRAILKNISYRSIVVTGIPKSDAENVMNKVGQIENVIKVIPSEEYTTGEKIIKIGQYEYSGNLSIIGSDETTQPNIVKGRGIKAGEQNVCIIPKKFYTDYTVFNYDKTKYIDGEELLGKKIEIEYYSYDESSDDVKIKDRYTKEFEVIGIYNAEENAIEANTAFVSYADLEEIIKNREDNTIRNPNVIYSNNSSIIAIVDNSLNVETALLEIQNLGYRAIVRSVANIQLVNIINIVTIIVSTFLIVIAVINIAGSSIKSIYERKYEIGMMKAIGYKNKEISRILFTENLIISIGAYVLALIVSILSMQIMRKKIFEKFYELDNMGIKMDFKICLIALVVAIIVPTISSLICGKKVFRETPVSLNKER